MYRQQLKWCCTIISTILCDCSVTLEIRIHGLGISLVACAEELFTVNFVYSGHFYHFDSTHVTGLPCLSLSRFVGRQLYITMVLILLVGDVILSNSNDSFASLEVEKQSKTKMDAEVDEPLPMPERKVRAELDSLVLCLDSSFIHVCMPFLLPPRTIRLSLSDYKFRLIYYFCRCKILQVSKSS